MESGAWRINSRLTANTRLRLGAQGRLQGDGTVVGNVENSGAAIPASTGALHRTSSYLQEATGLLSIRLASPISFGKLAIAGNANFDGTLSISLMDGFTPSAGNCFASWTGLSRSGTFATILLPSLPGGLGWNKSQHYTAGVLAVELPGGYNQNGVVDAADYAVWRDHFGQTFALAGENPTAATPGLVDQEGCDFWRARFGLTAGSGSGAGANATVPDPGTAVILIAGIVSICSRRRAAVP